MKIAVFGATGATGIQVVRQALEQGFEVRAFVRDPGKMTLTDPKLEIVSGDVLDSSAVDHAIEGIEAVVVALGSRPDTKATMLAEGTGNVITAMKKHGVKRLIIESSYPMSGSPEGMAFLQSVMPADQLPMVQPAIDDKINQEKEVRDSGLDWTIVRPLILTDGGKTGHYRAGETLVIQKTDTISRADVADFLLKLLSGNEWVGKTVTVAY